MNTFKELQSFLLPVDFKEGEQMRWYYTPAGNVVRQVSFDSTSNWRLFYLSHVVYEHTILSSLYEKEIKVNARQIDDNMKLINEGIKNGTLNVDDINNMKWPDTSQGEEAKKSAIYKLVLIKSGMAETEGNVNEIIEIRKMIANNQILNTHQKFWLPDEVGDKAIELMKLHGWTDEGGSITDRMGVTIGINHEEMLNNRLQWDEIDRKNGRNNS